MMTQKEKILWILYGIVLLLLFLLSSTNWIIKEKEVPIYTVSVIIEDISDENYVNFRKGMDRAAIDLNADVSFITLYDKRSKEQQEELILREQQDGSRALIVSPVDPEAIVRLQSDKRVTVPLILLNSEAALTGDGIEGRVSFDYYSMGQELAGQLEAEMSGKRVYLLGEEKPDPVSARFRDGLLDVLEPLGYELIFLEYQRQEDLKGALRAVARKAEGSAAAVALDPVTLTAAAEELAEEGDGPGIAGLYGRGTTVRLLNYLDKGIIQGLCITDDFSAGYLSVKMAVNLAENRQALDPGYLESRCIKKEDLRRGEYEKMLYPIE